MNRRLVLKTLGIGAASMCTTRVATAKTFAKPPASPELDRWRDGLGAARLREITRLREYRKAGTFPRNHRVLGRIPTFIDTNGRACAVGFLMQRSGQGELAARIAKLDNLVYIENI